jgi:hypothetical protein
MIVFAFVKMTDGGAFSAKDATIENLKTEIEGLRESNRNLEILSARQ